MNELVYLFELDSVRSSPQEILLGQWALFREIALKGNRVVLSFNQLTDSESFLSAVRAPAFYGQVRALFSQGVMKCSRFAPRDYGRPVDTAGLSQELAECRKTYPELFQEGVLKDYGILPSHSPQRVVRTGSHYIQNAVERCLSTGGERFLFSALPFRSDDTHALAAVHYALKYSDPSILDELGGADFQRGRGEGEGPAPQKGQVVFAKAYVELILHLSREPLAWNPPELGPHPSMEQYLNWVLVQCRTSQPPRDFPLWVLLQQGAGRLEELWPVVEAAGKINDRSDWYAAFRKAVAGEDQASLCMAEAIVDLCYNYTVAASIQGLSRSCREKAPFWADFLRRLPPYWEEGQRGIHHFLKPESTEPAAPPEEGALPKWDTAARLIQHVPRRAREASAAGGGSRAGRWGFCVASSLLFQVRSAAMYIALFVAVSFGLDFIESQFVSFGAQFLNAYLLPLVTILVFGVAGSQISSWFHLLDIWDSFKQFGVALRDGVVLLRSWRRGRGG